MQLFWSVNFIVRSRSLAKTPIPLRDEEGVLDFTIHFSHFLVDTQGARPSRRG